MKNQIVNSLELQIEDMDKQIYNLLRIRNDLYMKRCNIIDEAHNNDKNTKTI